MPTTQAEEIEEYPVRLRNYLKHPYQKLMVGSTAKRLIIKAGRRGGKTVGIATRSVIRFAQGRRQLYTAPTTEQTNAFWYEVKRALREPIDAGVLKLNESEQFIELPGTQQRIKAKTAWNADMMRGDYADDLYMDEFQLQAENAWDEVGAPMLLDNNGDAVLIFTPPSLKSVGISKARDPRHASKLFKDKQGDKTGLWETMHFTSLDNPFISKEALGIITGDMSLDSYRREIMAEDDEIELSWLVYHRFNEAVCKVARFQIPATWPVYTGHDFGKANPAALFLARVKLPLPAGAPAHMRYNDFVIFQEYSPGPGFSIAQHADRFHEICRGYQVMRSVGGNVTTEDEIRQGYTAHGWPIQEPKITRVNAQLDRVIGLFEMNKVYIFNDLSVTLGQIANCMWKLDEDNRPTNIIENEARYHMMACWRYIGSDFTPETVTSGEAPVTTRSQRA